MRTRTTEEKVTTGSTAGDGSADRRGVPGAAERITAEVTSWAGVSAGHGSRGEFAFRLGRRELGHIHGDRSLHIGFPKRIGRESTVRKARTMRSRPIERAGRTGSGARAPVRQGVGPRA